MQPPQVHDEQQCAMDSSSTVATNAHTAAAPQRQTRSVAALPLPVLHVTYRVALDSGICASLLAHLVQFLLYFRGQIPCVYDELLGVVLAHQQQQEQQRQSGRRKTRLQGGPMKKAIKCVSSTERLLHTSLPALFHDQLHTVVLIFGASAFSPREVFVVDFGSHERLKDPSEPPPPPPLSTGEVSPLPRPKVLRLCAQKLIRALIANAVERFTSGLAVTSLHVAALAPKRTTAIAGFVPRQSFRLRLPKPQRSGVTRTHYIRIRSCTDTDGDSVETLVPPYLMRPDSDPAQPSESSSQDTQDASPIDFQQQMQHMLLQDDPNLIWYVSDQSIAGFGGAL